MTLAKRIKRAMEYAGLTKKELADKIGLEQNVIDGLEHGRPGFYVQVVHIALECDVDPVWLTLGLGDMK